MRRVGEWGFRLAVNRSWRVSLTVLLGLASTAPWIWSVSSQKTKSNDDSHFLPNYGKLVPNTIITDDMRSAGYCSPFSFFLTELWSERANGSSLGKGKVSQKEQLYAVGSFVYC